VVGVLRVVVVLADDPGRHGIDFLGHDREAQDAGGLTLPRGTNGPSVRLVVLGLADEGVDPGAVVADRSLPRVSAGKLARTLQLLEAEGAIEFAIDGTIAMA